MRRLAIILILALALAPGTWLRTPVPDKPTRAIEITTVEAGSEAPEGWQVEGVWQISGNGLYFGGFSAILALSDNKLRAFSDRSFRFTFREPGPLGACESCDFARQVPQPDLADVLWDIESATRDPGDGTYWLGYEYEHAIQRFSVASDDDGVRELDGEVDWPGNSGAEALVRLDDGRFIVLAEGNGRGYLFAGDPVEGAAFESFEIDWPVDEYAPTDAAQLPDGRLLILMRKVVLTVESRFSTVLAIADPATIETGEPWQVELALELDPVIPSENYEGIAVRPREDGSAIIWLISDDNFSILQRTLLARLRYDPAKLAEAAETNEKAREKPRTP